MYTIRTAATSNAFLHMVPAAPVVHRCATAAFGKSKADCHLLRHVQHAFHIGRAPCRCWASRASPSKTSSIATFCQASNRTKPVSCRLACLCPTGHSSPLSGLLNTSKADSRGPDTADGRKLLKQLQQYAVLCTNKGPMRVGSGVPTHVPVSLEIRWGLHLCLLHAAQAQTQVLLCSCNAVQSFLYVQCVQC